MPWNWGRTSRSNARTSTGSKGWGTRELAEEMVRDDGPLGRGGTDESSSGWSAMMRLSAGPGTTRAEWRNFASLGHPRRPPGNPGYPRS